MIYYLKDALRHVIYHFLTSKLFTKNIRSLFYEFLTPIKQVQFFYFYVKTIYRIASLSFLNLEIIANSNISILYWISGAETIQGRKLYEEIRYVVGNV